jgi:hypothetical protein
MPQLETCIPARRPELVSCQLEESGRYLIRNRATGVRHEADSGNHFIKAV